MLEMRMAGEIDLAIDLDRLALGLDAVEFDRRRGDEVDALQTAEEIEMPPGAAELAVGGQLQTDFFLLLDDLDDFAVFDFLQRPGVDRAGREFCPRLLENRGAQQTADMIGAKWRRRALGHCVSLP